jgi:hypothetical protein
VAGQVRHVEAADITFYGSTTIDGGIQVEGRGGDLVFRKKSMPDGQFVLDLEAPGDRVAIGLTQHSITVERGTRQISVSLEAGSEQQLADIRTLLADSAAVYLTRVAAAAVQEAEDDSAASAAMIIGDALVGMLTGDPGAPGRAARYLSRHARTAIRRVATTDCYRTWERRVLRASYELESCARSFNVWNPIRNVCVFRWALQVESYWFTFLSCSGLNASL